jgi:hypothetical protein
MLLFFPAPPSFQAWGGDISPVGRVPAPRKGAVAPLTPAFGEH